MGRGRFRVAIQVAHTGLPSPDLRDDAEVAVEYDEGGQVEQGDVTVDAIDQLSVDPREDNPAVSTTLDRE